MPESPQEIASASPMGDLEARERAEEALAESEANLRALFDGLPGIVMTLDKDRRITSINRLSTHPIDQVLGRDALDFVPPAFQETAFAAFDHVLRTGEPTRYETISLSSPKDSPVWLAVNVGAILKRGEIVGLALATENITERKRLEIELRSALERAQATAAELEQYNRLLVEENAERRRTEEDLRRQREVVLRLSTPIIKAWEGVLVLPIIGAIDGERAAQMMERLLAEIARSRARFAVLDLTGVETMDTATVGAIISIVRAASLLGSQCLVSGISPTVAQTMIALGAAGTGFRTFAQMQDALRIAIAEPRARQNPSPPAPSPASGRGGSRG